jgi:UDP-N-acetylmuramyl pentapeptide phosphotransferase/UDP-N-acetylglucosamine-1-phosphate transferase
MYEELNVLVFLTSLAISVFATQRIIRFSKNNDFYDKPDARKLHVEKISNLGGVSVFMASMFAYFAFSNFTSFPRPDTLFSISILLFFIGLKDDIEPVAAYRRLAYEFICAAFIIYFTDVRIVSIFGIFTITDLPYWASFILTSIFIVACINAYNMIDGIDGLLGALSILGVSLFGVMFFSVSEYLWTILSISVLGALIGFLIYNWHPARIFMGNGGSMFMGTFFACISLRFMQLGAFEITGIFDGIDLKVLMPHTIAISIISIPIFDMLSVFIVRVLNKQSPFKADKRHTHHRLLDLGFSHWQVVFVLLFINITIVVFAYFVQDAGALKSLLYTLLYCICLQLFLMLLHWRNYARKKEM